MKDWTSLQARDVMTTPIITLQSDLSLDEAATTLSEYNISGALVTDYSGKPVGVVSLFDIVTFLAGLERPEEAPGGFYRQEYAEIGEETEVESLRKTPVAEIMSSQILSVDGDLALPAVIDKMSKNRIHRVFVTVDGKPEGVISSMDVLRCLSGGPVRA